MTWALQRGSWIQLATVCLLAALVGCDTSDDGGVGAVPSSYWISVEAPGTEVASAFAELRGSAECDACPPSEYAFGGCPPVQVALESGIDMQWANLTTGESGTAFHAISGHCSCLFSYCFVSYAHRWTALVPLAMGPNDIEIFAFGPAKDVGRASLTLTRTPAAPQSVEASGLDDAIEVRWDPVDGVTSYNLYWSTTPDVTPQTGYPILGVVSPFRHLGLLADETLHYAVTAVGEGYEGPPSDVVWATSGWRTEVLPTTPSQGSDFVDTSIAVDSLDRVHVHNARYVQPSETFLVQNDYTVGPGSWTTIQVAMPSYHADADLALDSSDVAHVSYADLGGAIHALWLGTWSREIADAEGDCDTSLALDAAGGVHLAYRAMRTLPVVAAEIRYASNTSGVWVAQFVDEADLGRTPGMTSVSLAVEEDGTAHLAYSGPQPTYGLRYATNQGGTWTYSSIESGYVREMSLALDAHGAPHVVYSDEQGFLRHARMDAPATWTREFIDGTASTRSASILIDGAGSACVSYVSSSGGIHVRYATNAGGSWRITRVAPAAWTDTDLALDSQGAVHISYSANGSSRHATNRRGS